MGIGTSGEASAYASDATLCAELPPPDDVWCCAPWCDDIEECAYVCCSDCVRYAAADCDCDCTTGPGTGTSVRPEAASCDERAAAALALVGTASICPYAPNAELGAMPMPGLCCFI